MPPAQRSGQKAASSAVYVGMSQLARLILTTLSTIIVSRILLPGDYGVIAMVAPVTAFILMFQDLGLSQATIQAKEISVRESSSLFWLNMSASALLTFILIAISPLVAIFYGDYRAGYVTAASSVNVLIAGTALQHSALLNRDMRFAWLSVIDIASVGATFVATVAAAVLFRSYWALWIGMLAGTIITTILMWRASGFRPQGRPSYAGVGEMARFGGNITGFNIVNFLMRNLDNILIAKGAGAAQLGLYDRSYRLMMLPLQNINTPLGKVMLPTLRRVRDDPKAYRRAYLVAVRSILLMTIPGIAVSVATSNELIAFLLGPRWTAAGPIFFWLSLTGLLQPLVNTTGWLFISSGRAREQLYWGLFSAVVTIAGFIVGLPYGATGIAASLFFTLLMRVPIIYWYSVKDTSVSTSDLYRSMVEPTICALVSVFVIKAAAPYLPFGVLLLAGSLLSYVLMIVLLTLTPSGRDLLSTLIRLTRGSLASMVANASLRKAAPGQVPL